MAMTDPAIERVHEARLHVVRNATKTTAPPSRLPLPNGEQVVLLQMGDRTLVQLVASDEQPRFSYDLKTGQLEIHGPIRSVKVSSSEESTTLESAGDLCLQAAGRVRVQGRAGVELVAASDDGRPYARARVAPSGVSLEAHELGFLARSARFQIARLDLASERLRAAVQQSQLTAERIEVRAKDLRSKLRSVVQEVETSLVTRAGRVREWISGTHHSRSQRVEIKAQEDVRIDGSTINLG